MAVEQRNLVLSIEPDTALALCHQALIEGRFKDVVVDSSHRTISARRRAGGQTVRGDLTVTVQSIEEASLVSVRSQDFATSLYSLAKSPPLALVNRFVDNLRTLTAFEEYVPPAPVQTRGPSRKE